MVAVFLIAAPPNAEGKGLMVTVFLITAPSNGEGLCEHEGTICVCCRGATNMCEAFPQPYAVIRTEDFLLSLKYPRTRLVVITEASLKGTKLSS